MALTSPHDTGRRRPPGTDPVRVPPGPLVWQRTDTVGTELVFQAGSDPLTATGSAVVGGQLPHVTRWHADLDTDSGVRALTVTCEGGDWSRTLRLLRDHDGGWTCRTQETGEIGRSPARSRHPGLHSVFRRGSAQHPGVPLPGIEDPGRLDPQAIVRLSDSPIFLTWALRRLRLVPGDRSVSAPTIRILTPSLVVLPVVSTYQLVSRHRLRVSGDEPATGYEVDDAGTVTYQPARLRLAR